MLIISGVPISLALEAEERATPGVIAAHVAAERASVEVPAGTPPAEIDAVVLRTLQERAEAARAAERAAAARAAELAARTVLSPTVPTDVPPDPAPAPLE